MVGSMIVAALAETTVAAFTFAQTAAAFAINFAVSQIVTRVFGQDQQGPQDNGVRQQIPPSSTNALPIAYGDVYMGGTFVDAVLSTDQKTMYYVLAVSSISPNGQFSFDTTKFYYGDRLITFDGTDLTKVVSLTDEAGNVDTKISGNLYINLYKSSASGTITPLNSSVAPSTLMGGTDISVAQRWPSTGRQMNGLGFAIVKLNYSQDAGTTSLNPITFHLSHYLNGAGCAKPGDVWYDYITNAQYGGAVDAAFVDSASATTLNTYSDQLITFKNSSGVPSTQPRYRMNGVLDSGQTVLSNIDKIMSCCDSWMAYNSAQGQWSVIVNKPETAAYSFDDNNIIGEIRVSATDITSSINQIEAKFPFKDNRDQPSFVQLATPSGLLYPNEPVNKYSITYDLVNESVQSGYLANRLLEQAREDLIVSFSTTYYGIQVDAGAVVSVTNSAYGWSNKLFRVMKVNEAALPDGSLGAKLELNEYNSQVYDDLDITAYTPAPNSNIPSSQYFSALAAPVVVASRPSASFPSFDVRVYIPATGRVTYGALFYTTSATPGPLDWQIIATAGAVNGAPATNGAAYYWNDLSLPTGTYYFAFSVSNDLGSSGLSPTSASFAWSPVGMVGPAGQNGLTAITAYKVQAQNASTPTFTTPTTGATAPTGWSLTAPSVSVGQVMWYIQGRYNSGTSTIDGVAGGTTAWTGPIAASIFQDIRSDNWNGSTPPVYGTPSTYGTQGYYIEQSTGDVFFNNGIFRANIDTGGQAKFAGTTNSSFTIPIGGSSKTIYYSNWGSFPTSGGASGSVNAGVFGLSSGFTGAYNVGVIGVGLTEGSVVGVGVVGQGDQIGGYFSTTSSTGSALECDNTGGGFAFRIGSGTFSWGGYTVASPSGSSTTFLRNDGTWSSALITAPANSGTATVSSGAINFLGSTSTGIAGAYVGTTGSGNTVTFGVQTTSPSDERLKEEIADIDVGLSFVNQLRPVSYKLKADPKHQKGYGFIAQEVEQLIGNETSLVYFEPDWQVGEEIGFNTIHYPSYIAVLTKAVQELSAKVEQQQKMIEALQNKG
jgi:hypothetical protein